MTDPVADFLTRIRNGLTADFDDVEIPASRLKIELAPRPLDAHELGLDGDVDARGHRDRLLSDSAHALTYQTYATTSPPTPARRASWPVMTPREVETIAVPIPPSTFGISPALT